MNQCLPKLSGGVLIALFCFLLFRSDAEDFESFETGADILNAENWGGFAGFKDPKPSAKILQSTGNNTSKVLGISHPEIFRADNFGLQYTLPKEYTDGVVWVQCRFKPSQDWTANFVLDARGPKGKAILGRIAAAPYENKLSKKTDLRWHCSWSVPHWRLYTLSELNPERWYLVTMRLDLDAGSYATWVDHQPLGEEAPLSAKGAFSKLYISLSGSPANPAMLDDLVISRDPPVEFSAPALLPEPEKDLLFRFSGIGDPQLGFGGYESDKIRFGLAVDQINRAGSDLSLILGDMVHFNDKEEAYTDLAKLAEGFQSPHYYVRGNHERIDLFLKHFNDKIDYSVVHRGFRFVAIDAVGNQVGLSEEQLTWIESEFVAANKAQEEIVMMLHVSPWQNNKRGVGRYNQIGPGRDQLRQLMKQHKVLLCLSGHYHTGLWHGLEEETHYLVLGGTALVKGGTYGWCLFDVYPDRIVMHQKPIFFGYEKPDVTQVHALSDWITYEKLQKMYPYAQRGPLTMKRHRPVTK